MGPDPASGKSLNPDPDQDLYVLHCNNDHLKKNKKLCLIAGGQVSTQPWQITNLGSLKGIYRLKHVCFCVSLK